jgi:hypothetical protein
MEIPDGLVQFARDIFLLARCGSSWTGEEFEEAVAQLARRCPGIIFVQRPGQARLFGRRGASRLGHEFDAGIQGGTWVVLVEAKATVGGPRKNDVLIFDGKSMDVYVDRWLARRVGPHYRVLASAYPIRDEVACYAAQRGIMCVEPNRVPLPIILRLLSKPLADNLFADSEMQEADRLFTPTCLPMEQVWPVIGDEIRIKLRRFRASDASDLMYLHDVMSERIVEYLDSVEPHWAADRARPLRSRSIAAEALLRIS